MSDCQQSPMPPAVPSTPRSGRNPQKQVTFSPHRLGPHALVSPTTHSVYSPRPAVECAPLTSTGNRGILKTPSKRCANRTLAQVSPLHSHGVPKSIDTRNEQSGVSPSITFQAQLRQAIDTCAPGTSAADDLLGMSATLLDSASPPPPSPGYIQYAIRLWSHGCVAAGRSDPAMVPSPALLPQELFEHSPLNLGLPSNEGWSAMDPSDQIRLYTGLCHEMHQYTTPPYPKPDNVQTLLRNTDRPIELPKLESMPLTKQALIAHSKLLGRAFLADIGHAGRGPVITRFALRCLAAWFNISACLQAVTNELRQEAIAVVYKKLCQTQDKVIAYLCVSCLSACVLLPTSIHVHAQLLLRTAAQALHTWTKSLSIVLEAFTVIEHVFITRAQLAQTHWAEWFYPVLQIALANTPSASVRALDVLALGSLYFFQNQAPLEPSVDATLKEFIAKQLNPTIARLKQLVSNNEELLAVRIWGLLVSFLGSYLHRSALLNLLLKVIELCFNSRKPEVKAVAFREWRVLFLSLTNKSSALEEKRLRLVMVPLINCFTHEKYRMVRLVCFRTWLSLLYTLGLNVSEHYGIVVAPILGQALNDPFDEICFLACKLMEVFLAKLANPSTQAMPSSNPPDHTLAGYRYNILGYAPPPQSQSLPSGHTTGSPLSLTSFDAASASASGPAKPSGAFGQFFFGEALDSWKIMEYLPSLSVTCVWQAKHVFTSKFDMALRKWLDYALNPTPGGFPALEHYVSTYAHSSIKSDTRKFVDTTKRLHRDDLWAFAIMKRLQIDLHLFTDYRDFDQLHDHWWDDFRHTLVATPDRAMCYMGQIMVNLGRRLGPGMLNAVLGDSSGEVNVAGCALLLAVTAVAYLTSIINAYAKILCQYETKRATALAQLDSPTDSLVLGSILLPLILLDGLFRCPDQFPKTLPKLFAECTYWSASHSPLPTHVDQFLPWLDAIPPFDAFDDTAGFSNSTGNSAAVDYDSGTELDNASTTACQCSSSDKPPSHPTTLPSIPLFLTIGSVASAMASYFACQIPSSMYPSYLRSALTSCQSGLAQFYWRWQQLVLPSVLAADWDPQHPDIERTGLLPWMVVSANCHSLGTELIWVGWALTIFNRIIRTVDMAPTSRTFSFLLMSHALSFPVDTAVGYLSDARSTAPNNQTFWSDRDVSTFPFLWQMVVSGFYIMTCTEQHLSEWQSKLVLQFLHQVPRLWKISCRLGADLSEELMQCICRAKGPFLEAYNFWGSFRAALPQEPATDDAMTPTSEAPLLALVMHDQALVIISTAINTCSERLHTFYSDADCHSEESTWLLDNVRYTLHALDICLFFFPQLSLGVIIETALDDERLGVTDAFALWYRVPNQPWLNSNPLCLQHCITATRLLLATVWHHYGIRGGRIFEALESLLSAALLHPNIFLACATASFWNQFFGKSHGFLLPSPPVVENHPHAWPMYPLNRVSQGCGEPATFLAHKIPKRFRAILEKAEAAANARIESGEPLNPTPGGLWCNSLSSPTIERVVTQSDSNGSVSKARNCKRTKRKAAVSANDHSSICEHAPKDASCGNARKVRKLGTADSPAAGWPSAVTADHFGQLCQSIDLVALPTCELLAIQQHLAKLSTDLFDQLEKRVA
ncbi:DNA-binding protein rif1 [Dimargaris verticillata]|uniref:DNA-binding protein rif1 n=1 Tax=Dimargaris verticillata TaxID=2761393 RepID=A0A9W8EBL8_9FUNG|nr:DNA-binding protein rif1 [Dimargaris verticillata]